VALVLALGTAGVAVATVPGGGAGQRGVRGRDRRAGVRVHESAAHARHASRVRADRPVPVGKPLGDSETLNLRFKGAGKPLPAAAVAAVIT